jgi:predicted NBD/HSP70 family sugar kinase
MWTAALDAATLCGHSAVPVSMDDKSGPRAEPDARTVRRRVGRPSTLEAGGASLATILALIRSSAATTRLEIEREAELGRAVVADRLATLERLGLVVEGELGPAIGGRAPRNMRFCSKAGASLAAHVDRESLAVGIADLDGNLIVEHHEAVDLALGPEAILDRLTTLFLWLLDERGGKGRAWAIGIALPEIALLDVNESDAFSIADLGILKAWRTFDFSTELSLRFGAPCWVRNNTEMMTRGEMKAGAGQGVRDLLCVRLDRSISAGVVSDGRLQSGAQGLAGLIGHAPTSEGGDVVCHCGAKGCLDALASGKAIAREAAAAADDGRSRYLTETYERLGEVTANDVSHGAQLGDAFCGELLARSGRLIGESLAPLVNLTNPEMVVLAGALAHSGEIVLAAVREAIYRRSHPLVTRDLRIVRSELGGSAELVGAAAIAIEEVFAPSRARFWIPLGTPRREPSFETFLAEAKTRKRNSAHSNIPPPAGPP